MCPWRVKIKQPLQKSRKLSLIYRTLPNQTVTEVRSKFWSWSFVKILKLNFSQEVDAEQNNKVTIEICSSSSPRNSARWRAPELPLIIFWWVVFAGCCCYICSIFEYPPKHSRKWLLGRGLKTKSWNIKTRIAELGVFMHKFAIENDPKP